MVSLWPGNKWLLGPEFKLHVSLNLKIRVGLKVPKHKEETWFVNSLSASDISKGFMLGHFKTQSTAGKAKDAVFLLVPLIWLSWISKRPP